MRSLRLPSRKWAQGQAGRNCSVNWGKKYLNISVLPNEFLFNLVVIRVDFKRNQSKKTGVCGTNVTHRWKHPGHTSCI